MSRLYSFRAAVTSEGIRDGCIWLSRRRTSTILWYFDALTDSPTIFLYSTSDRHATRGASPGFTTGRAEYFLTRSCRARRSSVNAGCAVKYDGDSGMSRAKNIFSSSSSPLPSFLKFISGAAIPARNLIEVLNCFAEASKPRRLRRGLNTVGRAKNWHR